MTMTVHRGHGLLDSDREIAASRIREYAIAAENRLHDLGAISIISSDALGMGRIAEVSRRTWQLAHVQAGLAGELGPDHLANDRVRRYLAKLTINPAIAHGLSEHVGSLRPGRLADVVLWQPAWFGALSSSSSPASSPGVLSARDPARPDSPSRGSWGRTSVGSAPGRRAPRADLRQWELPAFLKRRAARGHRYEAISASRGLTCADMVDNTATPRIDIVGRGEPVHVDGTPVPLTHAHDLPLTRVHHLA